MDEQGFWVGGVWVPDVHSPEFAEMAREASIRAAEFDREHPEVQDWIDEMTADLWNEAE